MTNSQITLDFIRELPEAKTKDLTATFADNMSLPVHRWFKYTAGFSAAWVKELLIQESRNGPINVIDPFTGSGTVLLECEFAGINSIGIEAHPYIHRIASTKLAWNYNADRIKERALEVLEKAKEISHSNIEKNRDYPKLIVSCYTPEVLNKLEALKDAYLSTSMPDIEKNFVWFLITSILRPCSFVGTAQWQYVLPKKNKAKVIDPFNAYSAKLALVYQDIIKMQLAYTCIANAQVYNEDARSIKSIPNDWGDLVITSPPYANNYDYADATRLEMTFWGDIVGWGAYSQQFAKSLLGRVLNTYPRCKRKRIKLLMIKSLGLSSLS